MKPEDVKEYFGSGYRFNKVTGMSHGSLNNWIKWGFIPEESQYKLERLTKGGLKAGTPINHEDRPSLEILAYKDLRSKLIRLVKDFNKRYGSKTGGLYPIHFDILVKILTECLDETNLKIYEVNQ